MKTWILILATLMTSQTFATAAGQATFRKAYLEICLKTPALGHSRGRQDYCNCMAKGYVEQFNKKEIFNSDLKVIEQIYNTSPGDKVGRVSKRFSQLFNFDLQRAEDVCMKHLD